MKARFRFVRLPSVTRKSLQREPVAVRVAVAPEPRRLVAIEPRHPPGKPFKLQVPMIGLDPMPRPRAVGVEFLHALLIPQESPAAQGD